MAVIADYIAAEQNVERIDSAVDAKVAAYMLMSSTFFRAFMEQFLGQGIQPSWDQFVEILTAVRKQTA